MALGSVSPVAIQQFFDNNGNPLSGGKLAFYLAGTNTPTPAYSDYPLTVPLPNPVILDAAGRAPELFLAALAYKQVLQTAAGVTVWTADNIVPPTALRSTSGTISLTGLQHDVPVPTGVISFIDLRNTAPLTIDGFANGSPGQILVLRAFGSAPVDLVAAVSSGSVPANQMLNFVGSGPTSLAPAVGAGGSGTAVYLKIADSYWILITHEQGGWLPLPYATMTFRATDAGGADAGAWTVEATDLKQFAYRLSGTTLLVSVAIQGATITGAGAVHLRINGLPYAWRTASDGLPAVTLNGGALPFDPALVGFAVATRELVFARGNLQTWTAIANGHQLYVQVSLDVS